MPDSQERVSAGFISLTGLFDKILPTGVQVSCYEWQAGDQTRALCYQQGSGKQRFMLQILTFVFLTLLPL